MREQVQNTQSQQSNISELLMSPPSKVYALLRQGTHSAQTRKRRRSGRRPHQHHNLASSPSRLEYVIPRYCGANLLGDKLNKSQQSQGVSQHKGILDPSVFNPRPGPPHSPFKRRKLHSRNCGSRAALTPGWLWESKMQRLCGVQRLTSLRLFRPPAAPQRPWRHVPPAAAQESRPLGTPPAAVAGASQGRGQLSRFSTWDGEEPGGPGARQP